MYCNSTYSSFQPINKGVPQGPILGPVLFFIYINDFVNASSKFQYTMYADDTNLLLDDEDINNWNFNVNKESESINNWLKSNNLRINITKTNYIIFQNNSIKHVFSPVTIEGNVLQRVWDKVLRSLYRWKHKLVYRNYFSYK